MSNRRPRLRLALSFVLSFLIGGLARAQTVEVSAQVQVIRQPAKAKSARDGSANVVLWLTPTDAHASQGPKPGRFRLLQKNKQFTPHLLVIPVGSLVDFPNEDPVFHNVFSFFNGKRFDLGLYESGSNRTVRFDHEGIDYIFCNIHSEMSAVVIALTTPYYAVSNREGALAIHGVPPGQYELKVWAEGAQPEELNKLTRRIRIDTDQGSLGTIRVVQSALPASHKNKFDEDYGPADVHPY
jgi:plastocyanin